MDQSRALTEVLLMFRASWTRCLDVSLSKITTAPGCTMFGDLHWSSACMYIYTDNNIDIVLMYTHKEYNHSVLAK